MEIFIRNQKSRTTKPEIPLKNEKSRTLNVKVIYPSLSTFSIKDTDEKWSEVRVVITSTLVDLHEVVILEVAVVAILGLEMI